MYDMANLKKMKTMKELAPDAMAAFAAFDGVDQGIGVPGTERGGEQEQQQCGAHEVVLAGGVVANGDSQYG